MLRLVIVISAVILLISFPLTQGKNYLLKFVNYVYVTLKSRFVIQSKCIDIFRILCWNCRLGFFSFFSFMLHHKYWNSTTCYLSCSNLGKGQINTNQFKSSPKYFLSFLFFFLIRNVHTIQSIPPTNLLVFNQFHGNQFWVISRQGFAWVEIIWFIFQSWILFNDN